MKTLAAIVLFGGVATASFAAEPAAVAAARGAVIVAHGGAIEVFDEDGMRRSWGAPGVAMPSFAVASETLAAVVDSLNDEIRILDLEKRTSVAVRTGPTPVAALFHDRVLYVLERDAARLSRYDERGRATGSVSLEADPAFVRRAGGLLYVYSRTAGSVQEVDADSLELRRAVAVAPGASDFEMDGGAGYLAYPREAKIRTFNRETMIATGSISVGAVPLDVALAGGANAISATRLAVADPSSKRVWTIEGRQTVSKAFLRGFLRGFLGLGAGRGRNSAFPTGVDRIAVAGPHTYAYDTSSGTLYRVRGKKVDVAATGVAPAAFAVTSRGVAVWADGFDRPLVR